MNENHIKNVVEDDDRNNNNNKNPKRWHQVNRVRVYHLDFSSLLSSRSSSFSQFVVVPLLFITFLFGYDVDAFHTPVPTTSSLSSSMVHHRFREFLPSYQQYNGRQRQRLQQQPQEKRRTMILNPSIRKSRSIGERGMTSKLSAASMMDDHQEERNNEEEKNENKEGITSSNNNDGRKRSLIFWDYFQALRPVTVLQAVGALVVGHLTLIRQKQDTIVTSSFFFTFPLLCSILSVFLSYGAGMVMNDCVDIDIDSIHQKKQQRAMASGRISQMNGWIYVSILCWAAMVASFGTGIISHSIWCCSNILVMLGYALGLQRVFLVKNLLCGWLAISPLIGAALLGTGTGTSTSTSAGSGSAASLIKLACIGFPMHVAREIVKDIEDTNEDQIAGKSTIPIIFGTNIAHKIAYSIVACVSTTMICTPIYWKLFYLSSSSSSSIFIPSPNYNYLYPISVLIGIPMCIRAYLLPISQGQKVLKKSIYVLLVGMIGSLLLKQ